MLYERVRWNCTKAFSKLPYQDRTFMWSPYLISGNWYSNKMALLYQIGFLLSISSVVKICSWLRKRGTCVPPYFYNSTAIFAFMPSSKTCVCLQIVNRLYFIAKPNVYRLRVTTHLVFGRSIVLQMIIKQQKVWKRLVSVNEMWHRCIFEIHFMESYREGFVHRMSLHPVLDVSSVHQRRCQVYGYIMTTHIQLWNVIIASCPGYLVLTSMSQK